ncbi:hypothetical protein [Sphingomonas sp. R1]|uniref:hypothetical protein n=1 Tax=Sphingomonas sp. R1 TaxID=399176 RepID=UPI0022254E1B|nr:hypothetical protein [Sphingomonas sp. R1]UYY76515.1 hypothetical protein OIM94_13445 [Sphingomonas sp. R1]
MTIRPLLAAAVAFGSFLATPCAAQAQGRDPFGECLRTHSSRADRDVLIRWVYAAVSQSAAVRDMVRLDENRRVQASQQAGQLITRLVTRDCREQAMDRIKRDPGAIQNSFTALGRAALMDLAQDPAVVGTLAGVLQYTDMGSITMMLMEGGLRPGG